MVGKESKEVVPKCKLIWEKDTPIVECDNKDDVTNVTRLINEKGILIREVKILSAGSMKKGTDDTKAGSIK